MSRRTMRRMRSRSRSAMRRPREWRPHDEVMRSGGGAGEAGFPPRDRSEGEGVMIARLRGRPAGLGGGGLVLDVNGVGYLVQATPSVLREAHADRDVTV